MNLHFIILHSVFFLLQISGFFFINKVQSFDANTDRESLLSMKIKLSDPQNILSRWTNNTSHCTWYGITCSANGHRVRSLNLSGASINGVLPPHISNLTSLFSLDLTNNSFYGPIPSEFSKLSHLQFLILRKNSINGTIPPSLSQCTNLKSISLMSNKLSGNIPSELGSLQGLKRLDFSDNNLTGSIPTTFGNLTSLTSLALARNRLVGEIPVELGRLRKLQWFQLSENEFSGEIPFSVFNISSLVFISLTDNTLTGKLPDDLGSSLPNLRSIYLAANFLQGFIPISLSNTSSIQFLDLSFNGFEGPIPLFGKMNNLVELSLGNNSLTSSTSRNFELIDSLRNCTRLEVFKVFSNKLAGLFPSSVANLSTHLQHFCISDNFLSGSFPKGMENFPDLISLSIEENSFSGEIPTAIGNLKNLQSFLAYSNMFTGEIPDVFGNFSQLSEIMIGYNRLSGRIPSSIGACQRLSMLSIGGNRLNGRIPNAIFGLSTLVWLNLKQNDLTGSLPGDVGKLMQLQFMDISDNNLSGNIPSLIGSCSSLETLRLARNHFVGSIPETIGQLTSLEDLDLSSNRLTGIVPEELEKLEFLRSLNLSFNDFEGEVPSDGVFMNFSNVNLHGNKRLCVDNQTIAENLELPRCTRRNHLSLKIIVPVAAIIMFIVIGLFCFIYAFMFRKKQKNTRVKTSSSAGSSFFMRPPPKISYADIRLATGNFAANNLMGKGAFASVYKGTFSFPENGSGTREVILAIKVLDLHQAKSVKSFDAECEALRNARHRNLVKLMTSCSSIDQNGNEFKALIMEFMPCGNLHKWLYHREEESTLSLNLIQRLNIMIDIASALNYLHHDCRPPVVHCDLKPENVLLNDDLVAHVGDFGLARIMSQDSSRNECSTIGLKGSIGYIPPEYGMGSKVSIAGDVYSFGILLLETFIAKKPTDEMFKEGLSLHKLASAVDKNCVVEIADPELFMEIGTMGSMQSTGSSNYNSSDENSSDGNGHWLGKSEELVSSILRVGLACAANLARDRLTMREALALLKEVRRVALEM